MSHYWISELIAMDADEMRRAETRIKTLEAENAALREALLLAIGLALDLGLTEMEVDSVLMRAGADSLAALARQTEGVG